MELISADLVKWDVSKEESTTLDGLITGDVGRTALQLLPWVTEHKYFTQNAALRYLGMHGYGERAREFNVIMKQAFQRLGIRKTHLAYVYDRDVPDMIYSFVGTHRLPKDDVPLWVCTWGFTTDPDEPRPEQYQIQVVKDWLKEYARPASKINKMTSKGLSKYPTIWTRVEAHQYAHIIQTDEDGTKFQSPAIGITHGAFLAACIEAGYKVKRLKGNDLAYASIYMSVRKLGEPWRGPPRKAPDPLKPKTTTKSKKLTLDDFLDKDRVTRIIGKFLDTKKEVFRLDKILPQFTLKQVAAICRIPYKGRVPRVLLNVLKELGCVRLKERREGKRKTRWCRLVDMPQGWKTNYEKLPKWPEPVARIPKFGCLTVVRNSAFIPPAQEIKWQAPTEMLLIEGHTRFNRKEKVTMANLNHPPYFIKGRCQRAPGTCRNHCFIQIQEGDVAYLGYDPNDPEGPRMDLAPGVYLIDGLRYLF